MADPVEFIIAAKMIVVTLLGFMVVVSALLCISPRLYLRCAALLQHRRGILNKEMLHWLECDHVGLDALLLKHNRIVGLVCVIVTLTLFTIISSNV